MMRISPHSPIISHEIGSVIPLSESLTHTGPKTWESCLGPLRSSSTSSRKWEKIQRLHQLRLVVYPIICKVLAPSQVGFLAGFLNHQQYLYKPPLFLLQGRVCKLVTITLVNDLQLMAASSARNQTKLKL